MIATQGQSVVASDSVLDDFTIWCQHELFTPTMVRAAVLLECACDLHLAQLYRSLDLARHLETPKTASELTSELGYVDSASIALEAMLLRLAHRSDVVRVDLQDGPPHFIAAQAGIDKSVELEKVGEALSALGEGYAAAMEFLNFGSQHFVMALRDDPEFMDRVLSGRDRQFMNLWHRATNLDPLQDAHGKMGARLIDEVFDKGRVLEIGGGTGNGTRHLLRRFAERDCLWRFESYVFTDISLPFILATRQETRRDYPSVKTEWRHLDINEPFGTQTVEPESFDLIYGVNAAHVARDILAFLKECHNTLREGGKVVFSERVRVKSCEMAPRELTLNLCVYHRTAAIRNPEYRPLHAYLAPEHWLRALEVAGFRRARVCPNLKALADSFPDQYAAVVVGEK